MFDVIEKVHYHYTMFINAKTELERAQQIVELDNAVSDLITWHPDYDMYVGMPWQREDAKFNA